MQDNEEREVSMLKKIIAGLLITSFLIVGCNARKILKKVVNKATEEMLPTGNQEESTE